MLIKTDRKVLWAVPKSQVLLVRSLLLRDWGKRVIVLKAWALLWTYLMLSGICTVIAVKDSDLVGHCNFLQEGITSFLNLLMNKDEKGGDDRQGQSLLPKMSQQSMWHIVWFGQGHRANRWQTYKRNTCLFCFRAWWTHTHYSLAIAVFREAKSYSAGF